MGLNVGLTWGLLAGVVVLSTIVTLRGKRRPRWPRALFALAGFGFLAIWIHEIDDPGARFDGFLFATREITLEPGAEVVVPFEVVRREAWGLEVMLHLHVVPANAAWPGLDPRGSMAARIPKGSWNTPWTLTSNGETTQYEGDTTYLYAGEGVFWGRMEEPPYDEAGPFLMLHGPRRALLGAHEFRLRLQEIPEALHGSRARLTLRADFIAYKNEGAKAVARRAYRILVLAGCLLLFVIAAWARVVE